MGKGAAVAGERNVIMRSPTIPRRPPEHLVGFHESDEELVLRVGAYLAAAFDDGDALLVATPEHVRASEEFLVRPNRSLASSCESGTAAAALDAATSLRRIRAGGAIDGDAVSRSIGETVALGAHGRHVAAFGEMVPLLVEAGEVSEALDLEESWNELLGRERLALCCAYDALVVDGPLREAVSELHGGVIVSPLRRTESFAATSDAPRRARRFATSVLTEWGCERVLEAASVIVSELASNAVFHARSNFSVSIETRGDRLRITVHDENGARPVKRAGDASSARGRGLLMIEALATAWGVESQASGKDVWAELPR